MKKIKLMTHLVAGYPNLKESEKIAETMIKSGISFLEIQIPFSDPIADGPVIMKANETALEQQVSADDCFSLMKKLKQKTQIPLLFMTYYNIVFKYGLEKFCKKANKAGAYGLIIPDIPFDEEKYDHYFACCRKYDLHPIFVVSALTPNKRLKMIAKFASGFIYCVSHFGITGQKSKIHKKLDNYLSRIKRYIKLPIALGFGISTKNQVRLASKKADIVVIGSKIINVYNKALKAQKIKAVENFLKTILQ